MKRTVEQIRTEWLVLRCRTGDTEAFCELLELWQGRLHRHVYRLTEGHEDRDDLVQEVWTAVARRIRSLNDPAAFPHWLFRIATNHCTDWVRKRRRNRRLAEAEAQRVATRAQPERESDDFRILRNAIAELPADQRTILTMFYLEEFSTRQISEALSIPVGTVKSRLHTARNHLRALFERSAS